MIDAAEIMFFGLLLACGTAPAQTTPHLHITVTLARSAANTRVSGRLLIFMSNKPESLLRPAGNPDPQDLWMTAKEVANLAPGDSVEVDGDELAFPEPFSKAPPGEYRLRAVLDANHTYAYTQIDDEGDVRSEIAVQHLPADHVSVTLTQRVSDPPLTIPHAEVLDFESRRLSEFWGRPIHLRGLIVLPPSYATDKSSKYPTLYWTHGFGGTLRGIAAYELQYYYPYMERGERPEMIYVLLDQSCPFGTHEFANSVNNGPWGDALVKELIPALERKYRMDGRPSGRLLQGHSSGGWAALWLQINYPDLFGGTWPTAPDPVDFHAFIPVDLTSETNIYRKNDGSQRMVMRVKGKEIAMEDYARREFVLGEYGGQLSSFEAVFSPRGADGRPLRLFNRVTGEIDSEVAKAWEKYDIAHLLRQNWGELGPKLNGKIHLYVGTADDYYLDEPARLLQRTIGALGGKADFVFLPNRTHENVYDDGVAEQIWQQIWNTARPATHNPSKKLE
jgi:pimeloyl-ACP methyl ester carboxylesterase